MIALRRKQLLLLAVIIPVLLIVVFISFSFSKPSGSFTKLEDGIVVKVKKPCAGGASLIKLRVISGKVIHVTATPEDSFSKRPSLMAVSKKRNPVKWELVKQKDFITIKTAFVSVTVSELSGDVVFTDNNGKVLLKELTKNGRQLTPVTIDGEKAYSISQSFETTGDEAFYGLGQHQNGTFNYKGENVTLLQQNSDVAVPFVVSNKNYGLLWDNYSITQFGDGRSCNQLSSLRLYDENGNAGGLTAVYDVSGTGKEPVLLKRKENEIDYSFLQSLKKFPEGFSLGNKPVYWNGYVEPECSGEHQFLLYSGGYLKFWLDGKLQTDKWRQCWNPATTLLKINLEKGKKYPLKIEWVPDGGESFLSVKYFNPSAASNNSRFLWSSEAGDQVDYYFVYGRNMDEVVAGYRDVTGRSPIVPKWAMGFWQSRERYKSQDEILATVNEFRKRKIPLDNIVLDWFYWKADQWGSHEFDPARFPDPDKMIKELHDKYNTQFMISVWPKFYTGTKNYNLFNEKGWLYKQNVLNNQKDWIGYVSTFYDAYNPEARKQFWDLMDTKLYKKGIDAWWMDATEPDVLSNTSIEERKKLHGPTAHGPATLYFNSYALESAKAVYEGQRSKDPGKRVFILTRSAYAGMQRYAAATWSGDVGARWHDLKNQISAGINFSLSGLPYWTMDIGGFAVERRYENAKGKDLDEWREQMTRWYQFGAFCPLFRAHGQYPFREIFNVAPEDHPAYQSMLYYNKLRYRLMPYIYSLAGKTYHEDYTIMRALVMDFAADTAVKNLGDQYMFGPSLLINPVYEYESRKRRLYLPATTGWYDFYNGKYIKGGQYINADAPYEKMPLYVKEGSIITFGPELQYTAEKPADPITLFVYTGKDAQFTLYEDEGLNYNYEKSLYSSIPFSYSEKTKTFTIGGRKGSFKGMLKNRTFKIIKISKERPVAFSMEMNTNITVNYNGATITVPLRD